MFFCNQSSLPFPYTTALDFLQQLALDPLGGYVLFSIPPSMTLIPSWFDNWNRVPTKHRSILEEVRKSYCPNSKSSKSGKKRKQPPSKLISLHSDSPTQSDTLLTRFHEKDLMRNYGSKCIWHRRCSSFQFMDTITNEMDDHQTQSSISFVMTIHRNRLQPRCYTHFDPQFSCYHEICLQSLMHSFLHV